ncbi:hypothetical protein niasHT_013189 [Heterodera trifolii]|uniref:Lipid-binding serum glycoprotein C-terminal domain-containing protein n=1 Tax=Heterodera trifolii TaxID=157864 RepID=A0ABD2KUS3_9BILA
MVFFSSSPSPFSVRFFFFSFLFVSPFFRAVVVALSPPTLALRLSPRGLDFFSSIGHRIVERELPSVRFPQISLPIDAGPGTGRVNASQLRIPAEHFQSPRFNFSFMAPNAVQFRSQGGHINVRGLWAAQYDLIGIWFYSSGWVDVLATDIQLVLSMGMIHSGDHPQLRMFSCTANIGHIEVEIGGGVIPWLVNLFRAELGETLRQTLHNQLCPILQNNIVSQLNAMLASFPTLLEIGDGLFLKYAFTSDAQVNSSFLQTFALVEVYLQHNNDNSSVPVPSPCPFSAPVPLPLPLPVNVPMASLWLDRTVIDCLFRSLQDAKYVQFVIGPTFDGGHFAKFLSTSCSFFQLCIGRFFPPLERLHPNQHIDLRFHPTNLSSVLFLPSESALNITSRLFMDMHISPWTEHAGQVLARLEMNITGTALPRLEDGRVKGEMDGEIKVHFAELNSSIGNFSQKFLDTFDLLFKPILQIALKSALRVGFPLPTVEGIKMGNGSALTVLERGLRVDAELIYADRNGTAQMLQKKARDSAFEASDH